MQVVISPVHSTSVLSVLVIGARINEITTDKNAALRLYCQSGRRSGLAKQTLEKLGYVNVVNAGGVNLVLGNTHVEPATGPDCAINNC